MTASTSWSALGPFQPSPVNTGSPPLSVESDPGKALVNGRGYCARVTARSGTDTKGGRVIGKSFELGDLNQPAFRYRAVTTRPKGTPVTMSESDYLKPVEKSEEPLMPLFTWRAKEGACGYFVVVAKDQSFTKVVDVARTTQPSYAPRLRTYRLEVSKDPNFQDGRLLLDDITTAATAYTSSSTYPADADVYWRVRANDENGTGLNWSATRKFQRGLPRPAPGADNPAGGEFLPVLSWPSVPGAVSYDVHVDQADGTTRDSTLRSTAFTPILFYGTGVWRWQVRANFPGALGQTVPGAYSAQSSFTRYIGAPTGARSTSTAKRLLVSWDPSRAARRYRVQFSESNSFSRTIDSSDVENTSYAPRLTQPGFLDGGPIFWRVAALDEGNNLGGWSSGQVKLQRRMVVSVEGSLARGRRGVVKVSVKDARGRAVRRARVAPRGAGVRSRAKRTGKRGTVKLRLRPRAKGTVRFRVDKRGFRPGSATVRVG